MPRDTSESARNRNAEAFNTFRRRAVKKVPTKAHRPAIWENMLGTVYAMNKAREVQYFDYDYAEAVAFVGNVEDVRVHRITPSTRWKVSLTSSNDQDHAMPRTGKLVWFVKDVE